MLLKLIGNSAFGSSLMNPLQRCVLYFGFGFFFQRPKSVVLPHDSPSKNKYLAHGNAKMVRNVGKMKKEHKLVEITYTPKSARSKALVQFG